jgi:hypothetical protein
MASTNRAQAGEHPPGAGCAAQRAEDLLRGITFLDGAAAAHPGAHHSRAGGTLRPGGRTSRSCLSG